MTHAERIAMAESVKAQLPEGVGFVILWNVPGTNAFDCIGNITTKTMQEFGEALAQQATSSPSIHYPLPAQGRTC